MEFNPDPECPNCGAELGWPGSYNRHDGVEYQCSMCGVVEGVHYVRVSEMPTQYLAALYTYISRVDSSITRDGGSPRFAEMRQAVADELDERGETVSEMSLTHRVVTNKKRAYEIDDEFPGFFTIGSTPEDAEYEFGTPSEEMVWKSLVTENEAERLEQWDDVTVETL